MVRERKGRGGEIVPAGTRREMVLMSASATGEDGTESRFTQDARDSVTVIALNLDPSFFEGTSGTTSSLHFFR